MPDVYISTNFREVARRFGRTAALTGAIITAEYPLAAAVTERIMLPVFIRHTPVGTGEGHLPDNNLVTGTDLEALITPKGVEINYRNNAQSAKNEDGSGGGYFYVWSVVHGRAAITAPSSGPWSTGKLALRTPWGLRKSVGPAPANDFVSAAMSELRGGALEAGMVAVGLHTAGRVVESLTGSTGIVQDVLGGVALPVQHKDPGPPPPSPYAPVPTKGARQPGTVVAAQDTTFTILPVTPSMHKKKKKAQ